MFQSTRPRGARLQQLALDEIALKGFNPRAHVGRDSAAALGSPSRPVFQSTRPRGARQSGDIFLFSITRFNPRAHVGRDFDCFKVISPTLLFQSTRPRGARRFSGLARALGTACFNPRAHVGRDRDCVCKHGAMEVSIHAPTWGATVASRGNHHRGGFNPRAHVGRDFVLLQSH